MSQAPSIINERPQRPQQSGQRVVLNTLAHLVAITALVVGTIALLNYYHVSLSNLTISCSILGGGIAALCIAAIARNHFLKANRKLDQKITASVVISNAAFLIGMTALAVGIVGLWQYSQLPLNSWQIGVIAIGGAVALLGAAWAINRYITKKDREAYDREILEWRTAQQAFIDAQIQRPVQAATAAQANGSQQQAPLPPPRQEPLPTPSALDPLTPQLQAPLPPPSSGVPHADNGQGYMEPRPTSSPAVDKSDPYYHIQGLLSPRLLQLPKNDPQILQWLEKHYPNIRTVESYKQKYFPVNPNNANSSGPGLLDRIKNAISGSTSEGGNTGVATAVGGAASRNDDPL